VLIPNLQTFVLYSILRENVAVADLKDAILTRVDIVELIGNYVSLVQAGRESKGCCPFHEEKAASFHVNPEKGVFHCFGCKAGGNVIDFVMRVENLEFVDAMEWLANRYHIDVPRTPGETRQRGHKERLYDINEGALKFFRNSLKAPGGDVVREYLLKRGISESQVNDFDLGYAPREWQALGDKLLEHGARAEELKTLGLVKERRSDSASVGGASESKRHYDAFRHRLVFPIRNVTGRVIGFAGRALSDEDTPKYLNVTNTPLYDKSKVLYNLDRAKGVLREEGAVVVEGYMDVIGLATAGVTNTVATCGTAMTPEHVKLLSRYTDRFYLAFDGDEAGMRAVWSAGTLFLRAGLDCRVVALPEGVDPDDLVREKGRDAWQGLLAGSMSVVQFWLAAQRRRSPNADATTQRQWVKQLSPLYLSLVDDLARMDFLRDVASALFVLGAGEVRDLLTGVAAGRGKAVKLKRTWKQQPRRSARELNAPELWPREGSEVEALLAGQQLDKSHRGVVLARQSQMKSALEVEREVVKRLLAEDDEFRFVYSTMAQPDWFADAVFRELYTAINNGTEPKELVHEERFAAQCAELVNVPLSLDSNEHVLTRHRNQYYDRLIAEKSAELRRAIDEGDTAGQDVLFASISELKREIKPIRSKNDVGG
jgi:DNA primase catalytic core